MSNAFDTQFPTKLIPISKLPSVIKDLRSNDKKIVFTNGCFDILHKGHVYYLRESKALGDILFIGLNSDASVKRLKGDDRPINSELDRAYILDALEFVDFIVIFEEDTPLNLIQEIRPDVYTKGGDYSLENIIGPGLGSRIVEDYGGSVVLVKLVEGYSTTALINN